MKMIKWFCNTLLLLLLTLIVFWVSFFVIMQTKVGQAWAYQALVSYLEKSTDTKIQIENVQFFFPFRLQLDNVEVSRAENPIMRIGKLDICCRYSDLLQRKLIIPQLFVSDVHILQFPNTSCSQTNLSAFSWMSTLLSFQIKIENIDIRRIVLEKHVFTSDPLLPIVEQLAKDSSFNLQGNLNFKSDLTSHFLLTAHQSQSQTPFISLGIDTQNHHLSFSFHSHSLPLNYFSPDIPSSITGQLTLYAQGSVTAWKNWIQKSAIDHSPIEGHFKLFLQNSTNVFLSQLVGQELILRGKYAMFADKDIEFFDLKADLPHFAFNGSSYLSFKDQVFQTTFKGNDKNHSLFSGQLSCQLSDFMWHGFIKGQIKDLKEVLSFLPNPLQGKAEFHIGLNPIQKNQQKITVDLYGHSLQLMGKRAKQLDLHLQFLSPQGILEGGFVESYLEGHGLQLDDYSIEYLNGMISHEIHFAKWALPQLSIKGKAEQIQSSLGNTEEILIRAEIKNPLEDMLREGNIELTFSKLETKNLKLEELIANTVLQPTQNRCPIHLSGRGNCFEDFTFSIDASWIYLSNALDCSFHQCIGRFGPYPLQLTKCASFKYDSHGMRINDFHLKWGEAEIEANYVQKNEHFSSEIKTNVIPLELFHFIDSNLPIMGFASLQGKFNGDINHPQGQFQIDMQNIQYSGILYRNIQADLESRGSEIFLKNLSAHDHKKGFISANGSILLNIQEHFPFEFQIHSKNMDILDSDYVSLEASGDLTLKGNTKQSYLQGALAIDHGTVDLEKNLPNRFKTIDIQYFNLSDGEKLPDYLEKKEKASLVELDVQLNSSNPILIHGNGIQSEWKGSVQVTGKMDDLQVNGDLRIIQGEYNLNGKIFNLRQGNIHFGGSLSKKTSLYVIASKEIDRIHADIIVKGSVRKPVISFRSNPPLSQRDILSYILFNRGISDITPDQGDQLSQSFMSIHSNEQPKGAMDFLTRLRNQIGMDRLDFTAGDPEKQDIGLQIGKYLTEDIFVSCKESMGSVYPIISIEAKFRKNFKVKAEKGFGENKPVEMSIKWKKDY